MPRGIRVSSCLLFLLLSLSTLTLFGCGGSSHSPAPPPAPPVLSVSVTGAPTTLAAGATATPMATVTNDSTNAGVDWSCAPAGACGTFNPTHTASGATTTYTAPGTAGSVTLTATSTATASAVASATVTITAPAVSVAITGAPATLNTNGTAQLTGTVTNDSSNAGVDWTCAPAGTCGSFNPAHTGSGAPTTYTAPGTAAAVTVTATSTASTSAQATANITVNTAIAFNLSGPFAFLLAGKDAANHSYSLAGAINLDGNGNVSGGVQDYNNGHGTTSPQPTGDTITSGTYTIGADGRGTLILVTNNAALGTAGTENFSLTVVNSKHAYLVQTDLTGTAAGTLDFQTFTAASLGQVTGDYSFTVAGAFVNNPEVFGGVFTSNGNGALTHLTVDSNSNGTVTKGGTNTGTYTAPDTHGRGTMSFGGNNFVYYVVSPQALRLTVVNTNEVDTGSAFSHGSSAFSNGSLNGGFVFRESSAATGAGSFVAAGLLNTDGAGNVASGFADVDQGGTVSSGSLTGTYSIAANGYGNLTITSANTQNVASLGVYTVDPSVNIGDPNNTAGGGGALILDLDAANVGSGILLPRGASPTFQGNYAAFYRCFTPTGVEQDLVGQLNVSGAGAITGTADANDLMAGSPHLAVGISGQLTADGANPGRFTVPLTIAIGASPPALSFVIYQASTGELIWIETDTAQYVSGSIEQQQ